MRTWKKIWESLTRAPLGFNAEGRALGVGIARAQELERQDAAADVERYLRHQADGQGERVRSH